MPSGYSVLEYQGDGVTTIFAVNFTLGYLKKSDIYCRVGDEEDGSGNPVYRTLESIPGDPGRMKVLGETPAAGQTVLFRRITSKTALQNDFADGEALDDAALDGSFKQQLMIAHELLDGFGMATVYSDINLTGHKINNVFTDETDPTSLVTVAYAGQAHIESAAAQVARAGAEAAAATAATENTAAAAAAADAAAAAAAASSSADNAALAAASFPTNAGTARAVAGTDTTTTMSPADGVAQALSNPIWGVAGGTGDAITLTIAKAPQTALADGMHIKFRATAANTGASTLNVTLGTTSTGAKNVYKLNGTALTAGDIPGAGAELDLVYNTTLNGAGGYTLLNPAGGGFVDAASSTASETAAKTATLTGFALATGSVVRVVFANANTATASLTLDVNSTGAKAIYDESGKAVSATNPAYFPANCKIEFVYDGSHYVYKRRVVNAYVSGTSWYRLYSDGWKEQGGWTRATYSVTLLLSHLNTDYGINLTQYQGVSAGNASQVQGYNKSTTAFSTSYPQADTGYFWSTFGY